MDFTTLLEGPYFSLLAVAGVLALNLLVLGVKWARGRKSLEPSPLAWKILEVVKAFRPSSKDRVLKINEESWTKINWRESASRWDLMVWKRPRGDCGVYAEVPINHDDDGRGWDLTDQLQKWERKLIRKALDDRVRELAREAVLGRPSLAEGITDSEIRKG